MSSTHRLALVLAAGIGAAALLASLSPEWGPTAALLLAAVVIFAVARARSARPADGGRLARGPSARALAEPGEVIAAAHGFEARLARGWLIVDGGGRVPTSLIIGCPEPWEGEGQRGFYSADDLIGDTAERGDGHVNYGYWGGVDVVALSDARARALVARVVRDARGLVAEGRVSAPDPGPHRRAPLAQALLDLAERLALPEGARLARLLRIAERDPDATWRRLAAIHLLEDPALARAPERDAAIAIGLADERDDLRALALVARDGPAAAAEIDEAVRAGHIVYGLLQRVAHEWPPADAAPLLVAAADYQFQRRDALALLEALPPAEARPALLATLAAPDHPAFIGFVDVLGRHGAAAEATAALLAEWPIPYHPAVATALRRLGDPAAAGPLAAAEAEKAAPGSGNEG